jgi:hypothetical protein
MVVDERIEQKLFSHVFEEVLLSPALEHPVGDLDVAQVPPPPAQSVLPARVADSDEVARSFRDDLAECSEMMSPRWDASLADNFWHWVAPRSIDELAAAAGRLVIRAMEMASRERARPQMAL